MRLPVLLCGMAGITALAGCAGPMAQSGPAPGAVVVNQKPAPATPPPTRDDKGHLVTLADLTQNNPVIGQNEGLADSTPGETAMEAAAVSSESSSDIDNLEIVGDGLKGKLEVLHVGASRNDSNLLSVFAGVKNETGRKLEVEMQTIYRDKDGNSLSNGENWIPITLKPHEQTQYRSVALSPDATDFLVRIRHAAPAVTGP
jgi:uncharacterized protein DUF1425